MNAAALRRRSGAARHASTCCASISTTTRRRARCSTAPRSIAPASRCSPTAASMTVNLFGRDASFETSSRRIAAAFGADAVLTVQPTKEGNTVVLAMKQVTLPGRDELARRAENIETRWQLPARKWLRMMRPVAVPRPPCPTRPPHENQKRPTGTQQGGGRGRPAAACRATLEAAARRARQSAPSTLPQPTALARDSTLEARGRLRALDLDDAAGQPRRDRSLAQRRLARQAHLAHGARLAARRQDPERRRRRAHRAPLRRRQQRPASAGAHRQRRPARASATARCSTPRR